MKRCHFCGRVSNGAHGPLGLFPIGHGKVLAHPFCERDWHTNVSRRLVRGLFLAAALELAQANQGKRCDP